MIVFSIPRLTNICRVEFDVISETFRMPELSSIQLVKVCHCNEFILNVFDCFELSLAYMNVPLSYSRPRGPHPNGEGPVSIVFIIASCVALVVASHVWLGR